MPSRGSSERRGGVRVLVVDDSAAARHLIGEIFGADPSLELVGNAVDGQDALEMVQRLQPDVITMDLVMPRVDGLEAIRRIMAACATPIVVVATPQSSDRWVFEAMEAGAVMVLPKPRGPDSPSFALEANRLISAVKLTAGVAVTARRSRLAPTSRKLDAGGTDRGRATHHPAEIVAIAASTGGPPALARILVSLPADLDVPVLVVQHIADGFERGLARWLDDLSPLAVRVADRPGGLMAGEVLVASAGTHLGVSGRGATELSSSAPIGGFRPSATHLFRSAAAAYGRGALAVVLTGMGSDGADGLADVKGAGGSVIAQDEDSSIVYGMPRAAVATGTVDRVLPVGEIAAAIARRCRR